MICPTKQYKKEIAIAISGNKNISDDSIAMKIADELYFKAQHKEFQEWLNGKGNISNSFEFTEEQLDNITNHSMLVSHDGLHFKMLDEIVHKYKVYKAGIQNKVFTSLEIEQAFVDATVAAMYTVQSKQVQVKRNDKIEYRLVSDLQVKDIKDNPNLDNVNLVIAHLKDVVKTARKDVRLFDTVRKQLFKWKDNPMELIDGIYNQASDNIKSKIQLQYNELKQLKNDYNTINKYITDRLNIPILKQMDDFINDLETNKSSVSILNQARVKLEQTYGDRFLTLDEVNNKENSDALSRNFDDNFVYSKDVVESFNQIIINMINSLPFKSIDNNGNMGIMINPHTRLRETVKFTEVQHNLKWKLANPHSPEHLIQLMRENAHQYMWLNDLADILVDDTKTPNLLQGFFTYFKNTLTPEHVAIIQNDGENTYKTSMRILSPVLGQEMTDSLIGQIMDLRNNPEKIDRIVLLFEQYRESFDNISKNKQDNKLESEQIKSLFTDIKAMLALYDIEVNNSILYKIIRGETLKRGLELNIDTAHTVLNENIKSPLYYITLHSKENETFTDIGNLNTITTLISNYDDSNISASYKAADNATKHGVRLPNGISDFINMLHKAEAGEQYEKELLDTLVEYTKHPGLVESNWLVSRVHNDQLVEGFLNKVEDGNLLFHYELNKKYLSKLAVTLNGGLKHINSTESAIFKTLEDKDFALSQLIAFIDNSGKNKNRDMVYLPTPILSDSSNHNFILTNRITLSPTKDYTFDDKGNYKIVPGSTISAIGYQKFKQEYYTMKYEFDYMFDVVKGKIQLKDVKNLVLYENKHYTINEETGEKEYLKNGLPTGKVFKFQVFDALNDIVKIDNNGVPNYTELNHKAIEEVILNEFEKQATETRLELKELQQFLPDTREYIAGTDKINNEIYQYGDLRTSNAQFAKLILEMTVNNFVSNTELQNMLLGNLDEFPNFAATVKRSKIISTPSIEPYLTENINIQTIDDINVESDLLELYKVWAEVALEQRGLTTENPAYQMIYKDTIDGYKAITATDGQSFYSTNFYVKHLKSLLRFEQYEHLFETYQRNGKTNYRIKDDIALDDIKNMITVVKPLFGNRSLVNNDGHLVMVSNQIKTSAVPLSDNLFKGSILSELAEYMNDNNVHVLTFRSTQKQMVTGVEDVLHNEKVFDVNTLKDVPIVTIPANSYKVVLDVVDHTRDSENKAGVQFMKLIYGNLENDKEYDVVDENDKKLTGRELFLLGQELASANIIETAKDLYNELGATEVDGKLVIIDKKKLSETLERDIKTRGYSDVELKSILLELTNEGNEFNLPLYFSTFNKRWQNVLTSLFTNRITNQKLPGSHVVLISNVFKDSLKNGEKGKVSGSKDLKAVVEVNGEEVDISTLSKSELVDLLDKGAKLYLEAYISPFSKQFFDDDGKLIPFEQLEGNPLLDNIGYRIPSSGKHSVATLRVKGWIQSPYSASIIVADDIVNATGTDFDVDSLFMIHKHFTRTQNEDGTYNFKVIPYKQSLEDRYIAYVRDNMNHKYSEYDTDIYEFKEQFDDAYDIFKTNLDVNQTVLKMSLVALKELGTSIFFSLPMDYQEQYKNLIKSQKSNNTYGILQQIELAEFTKNLLTTDINDNVRETLNKLLKNEEDIITAYSVTDIDYRNYLKLFRQAKLDIKTSTDYQFALHKLIANYERLEDIDTFSKRRYSSTVSKQARENKLIDIFESILQSKHNMLEKLRPAKFNEHESLTELFPTDMSGNPSWLNTQLKYRTATSAGKRSLSIAASINANIFVYQNVDASFFLPLKYTYILNTKDAHIKYADLKNQIGDKMFNRMLLNTTLEDLKKKYDVAVNNDGTITITHNRIGKNNFDYTNIEHGLITDTVGELVDYTVDAVKNPLPANVNEHSIMWAVTLEAIGMRAFDSIAFLQLPVVKEVVSYIKSTRFVLGGKNNAISSLKFNYKFIIQQAYQILQGRAISDKEFNGILKELKDDIGFEISSINFVKESLNPTTNDILDKLLVICDTKPKYLRNELTKLLRDLIDNKPPDIEKEIMGQILIAMNIAVKRHNMLDFLAKVEDMSSTLSRVNNALSTDKVGLSPTLTDAHNLVNDITKQRYHEVSTTDNEGNVTLHQGIVTNGTIKNTVEEIYKEDSKYSSYRDKYIYGIQIPLQMLEPLFISETPLFSNLHSKVVGDNIPLGLYEHSNIIFSHLGIQDRQAINDKLYNHTMQTLMMDIDLFKIDNLEAGLLLGLNELTDANDEIIPIEDRPFHTLSLAEQIKNIKKELNIQRNDNHILNYITVKNSVYDKRNSKIDIITLKRISMDSTKNLYIKQLKDMFFNATINQNLLVTNIIKYSYLTDGLMFKSNTLAQLIDVDIWQDLKIPEQMRRIHDRAKDDFSINQLGNIKTYFREFMLNNLQDNKIAPIISAGKFNEKVGDKTFNIFNDHINAYKADPSYRSDLVISNKTIKYKMFALTNTHFFKVWYKNGNTMELAYFEKIGKVSNIEAKDGNPAIDGRVLYVRVNPNGTKYVGNLTEDAAPLINSELESTEQIALNYQKARDYYNSMEEYKNAPFRNMSLLNDYTILQDTEENDDIDGEDINDGNNVNTTPTQSNFNINVIKQELEEMPTFYHIDDIAYSKNKDNNGEFYYVAVPFDTKGSWEEIRKKFSITEEDYIKSYPISIKQENEKLLKQKKEKEQKLKEQVYWNNNENNIVNKTFDFNVGINEKGEPYEHKIRIEKLHLLETGNYRVLATNTVNGNKYDMVVDENGFVISYTKNGKTFKGEINDEIIFTADVYVKLNNIPQNNNTQYHRLIHLPRLSFQQQQEHAKNLQARFAKVGLNVEVKWANLNGGNSKVEEIDGKLVITIDPEKARQDSVYHEFGHILVDMSQDQEFIKAGIEQLRGGELWNKIKFLYKDLTDEQLGREVLTTAVGIEAATNDFSNEKGWKFWFNRLLQRISNFIYKITNGRLGTEVNIARELARQLTRGDIRIDVNAEMSEREQWQRSDEYVSELNKTHDYLVKVRELYQRLMYMNHYNITPSGEALRKNMQKGIDNINIEVLRDNMNYVKTGIALTTMQAISQQELQRFEIILKEQVKIFNNPELDPRNFDKESIKRLTDILYQAREFIANYNEVENIDLKEMETTDLGTLSAEERSVYTAYKGIQNTFDMIKKDDLPRIKQLKLKYKILSDIVRLNIVANTSNPNISDYRKASNETQFDDNIFQSTFLAIGDSHHIVVANLAKIIRTAIDDRDLTYDKMFREFIRSWNNYKKKNGNAKNLFNEYGQLHQEYNREQFRNDAKEYAKQEFIGKDGKLYKNNINDFYREHITYTSKEDIQKAVDIKHQELLDKKITDTEYAKWILDNLDVDMDGTYKSNNYGIFAKLDDTYRNKKYDALNGADLEMYNTLKTLYDTLFKGLGTLQSKYFLPAIIAKGMEETLKGKNDWFESENNPEITEHLMNANNERVFQVPLSYVGLISAQPTIAISNQMNTESSYEYEARILKSVKDNYNLEFKSIEEINNYNEEIMLRNKRRHGEAVDYDLGNVIPKLIFSINNYKAKKDIEGLVLVAAANIKEEQIASKNGYGNPIVSRVKNIFVKEKKLETTEGSTSKIYKHLIKSIEMNFYEEFMKPSSHMNTLKALRQYQSILGLGFNVHAGVKNITYGVTQSLLLGNSGTFYSNKDLVVGNADYNKGLPSYFADIHRKDGRCTTIESALIKRFNIISNYNEMMEFDDEGTRAYAMKMFNNAAFAMQESGEHLMQNTLLFTMMRSHKLIDGKLVTFTDLLRDKLKVYTKEDIKAGKTVAELKEVNKQIREDLKKQFDEATSIRDMFVFEDGVAELKEEFKDLTKQISEFKDRVRGVSHKLHGIYNKEDKGAIENTILGQLLMQFRRWAPAGYVSRFGTRGGAFKVDSFWNERRQDYDIGSYTALFKFLGASQQDDKYFNSELPIPSMVMQGITNILKDYGNLVANCRLYYNTLTVAEQREATRAIQELAGFVGLVILYIAARNIGGDDKELKRNRAYNFFLYQISALRAETGTFVPIYGWVNEANKFFKSPAAVWRLGSNLINIGVDAIQYPFRDDGNYFKGGRHNKELKLKVHSLQVVPFYPQIDRVFNRNNKEVFGLYW